MTVFGSTLTGLSGTLTSTTSSGSGNMVAVLDNGLINSTITALRNLNFAFASGLLQATSPASFAFSTAIDPAL